jgi:hypothetical protein
MLLRGQEFLFQSVHLATSDSSVAPHPSEVVPVHQVADCSESRVQCTETPCNNYIVLIDKALERNKTEIISLSNVGFSGGSAAPRL